MNQRKENLIGLTNEEVVKLEKEYGKNEITSSKKDTLIIKILHSLCEPMFLLLIIASSIYFLLGEPQDGIIMLIFVIVVMSIDMFQEWKTDKTLSALKKLSTPHITVLRDNKKIEISSIDLLPGDIMYIHEGIKTIESDAFRRYGNNYDGIGGYEKYTPLKSFVTYTYGDVISEEDYADTISKYIGVSSSSTQGDILDRLSKN